jgi:thiamine pyrophosphokinase
MIIKLVCAGPIDDFTHLYYPSENEILIGVDKGALTIINKGLELFAAIGDFDSVTSEELQKITNICDNIIPFSDVKDKTDLELAVEYAAKFNPKIIIVYNATSGRLDHFYVGIKLLEHHSNLRIVDENNYIYPLLPGKYKIHKERYFYASFFAIEESIITLEGFKYPLSQYTLKPDNQIGVSNEVISDQASITIEKGKILVIKSK